MRYVRARANVENKGVRLPVVVQDGDSKLLEWRRDQFVAYTQQQLSRQKYWVCWLCKIRGSHLHSRTFLGFCCRSSPLLLNAKRNDKSLPQKTKEDQTGGLKERGTRQCKFVVRNKRT